MLVSRIVCLYLTSSSVHAFKPIAPSRNFLKGSISRYSLARNMSSSNNSSADGVGLSNVVGQAANSLHDLTTTTTTSSSNLTSWRGRIEPSIGKSRKVRGGNFVQIATVDSTTNEPRCRTVVFRGFLDLPEESPFRIECDGKPCIMKMITDSRSNKVTEVLSGQKNMDQGAATVAAPAEMVWWFSKSSEQYRIRGEIMFVGGGQFESDSDPSLSKARKEQWGNLSDMAREQFFWTDPGTSYSGASTVPVGGRGEDGKVLPAPDAFLLMLLLPKHIDYLRLTDNFRQVDEVSSGDWTKKRVNP